MTISPRGRPVTKLMAAVVLLALAGATGCGSAQARQSAPASPGQLSQRDRSWLNQAHQADLAEMDAGQHAEANGTTAALRSAGAMLVHDHAVFDFRLVHLATLLKVSLIRHLTSQQTEVSDRLSSETGPAFDNDFIAAMITGHQYMIAATKAEILHGSSPRVIGLARQALPVLEKHLRILRTAAGSG